MLTNKKFFLCSLFIAITPNYKCTAMIAASSSDDSSNNSACDISCSNSTTKTNKNSVIVSSLTSNASDNDAPTQKANNSQNSLNLLLRVIDKHQTPFILNETKIKRFLIKNPDFLLEIDELGNTALDHALKLKNYELTKTLLRHGSTDSLLFNKATYIDLLALSLNKKTGKVYSQEKIDRFLYQAATHGETTVAKLLLSLGANPNSKPFHNKSPNDMAARYGHMDIIELFESYSTPKEDLKDSDYQ